MASGGLYSITNRVIRTYLPSQQGSTTLSLILLSILSVSLLHSTVTSRPSYLAGKGEKLRNKKTQTYTTWDVMYFVQEMVSVTQQALTSSTFQMPH